jgi:hypothetical protein
MNVTEILQFADNLVFSETKKHLDDLQQIVIKGVWEDKTYETIAEECNRSENHVRDVGYKLLRTLSNSLGEDINKRNFRATFERVINSFNHPKSSQQVVGIINNNVSLCLNSPKNKDNNYDKSSHSALNYKDLTLAPKINQFYGREQELLTLSQWLENPNTQLISILGLRGIGKTTLVKYLIDTHSLNFDAIIWKNLKISPHFESNILSLLDIFPNDKNKEISYPKNKLNQCFELLQNKRFLIILDDVQELFTSGKYAGNYQPEYQDYQTFFQHFTSLEHQSCLILISQEKCQEMISLDSELYPSYCLELQSLGESAKFILQSYQLKNEESYLRLIELYEGNSKILQLISLFIKDIFQENLNEFLQEDEIIIPEDLKTLFNPTWLRLSKIEQDILLLLSQEKQPLTREEIKHKLSLSSTEIYGSLQSLLRRFLILQTEEKSIKFIGSKLLSIMV